MDISSRRPQWAQESEIMLHTKDWKDIAWSDESWVLLWHLDGRIRTWNKQDGSMDPSCLISSLLVYYCCTCLSLYDRVLMVASSSQKAQISCFLEHVSEFNVLLLSNKAPFWCGETGSSHQWRAAETSAAALWCYQINTGQNRWGVFPAPYWICVTKD